MVENLKGNQIREEKSSQANAKDSLSANCEEKAVQQIFPMPEDSMKKTILFLNKLESDIIFRVQDQEFPAHKNILSERCKFFKNMFSSKFFI